MHHGASPHARANAKHEHWRTSRQVRTHRYMMEVINIVLLKCTLKININVILI